VTVLVADDDADSGVLARRAPYVGALEADRLKLNLEELCAADRRCCAAHLTPVELKALQLLLAAGVR
jgi:hypothetical protein